MMSLGASAAAKEESEVPKRSVAISDPGAHLFPQVQKVDDGLYTWPVNGVLHGCMERVTKDNIDLWKHFGKTELTASANPTFFRTQTESLMAQLKVAQESGEDINPIKATYQKACSDLRMLEGLQNGSRFFCQMLTTVRYTQHELWVCYITSGLPQHIPTSIMTYNDPYTQTDQDFAQAMKMFVTVISHPDALFTSHVGIAATVYRTLASITAREVPISTNLDSGAAKVMLMRNPKRRWTINQPTPDMGDRLVKVMDKIGPNLAFKGTRAKYHELKETEKNKKDMTLETFRSSSYNSYWYMFQDHVSAEDKAPFEGRVLEAYNEWKQSSYVTDALADLSLHMPILEQNGRQPWPSMTLTIFEPGSDKVWLRADTDDPTYNWISDISNMAVPYLAIDLHALAGAID